MHYMNIKILRGQALTFTADPFLNGDEHSYHYENDALIIIEDGKIKSFGSYKSLKDSIPDGSTVTDYKNSLILPGFIDTHVHYPQTQMIRIKIKNKIYQKFLFEKAYVQGLQHLPFLGQSMSSLSMHFLKKQRN